MNLDTVVLTPDEGQIVLLWRAIVPAADAAMSDIEMVVAGLEKLSDPAADPASLVAGAKAKHAAGKGEDPVAEAARIEAEGIKEVQVMLEKVDLPPGLRATLATEKSAEKIFEALTTYATTAVRQLGGKI